MLGNMRHHLHLLCPYTELFLSTLNRQRSDQAQCLDSRAACVSVWEHLNDKKGLQSRASGGHTWYTLDKVGHHRTKVSSDVFKDLGVFIVFSFQVHSSQIHIFQEQSAKGKGVAFQSAVCTAGGDKINTKRSVRRNYKQLIKQV